MFLKAKIIQIFQKYAFLHKSVSRFSLAKILASSLIVIFFGVNSINAQIENDLYGQQTGDLAGVSSLMLAVSSNDIDGVKFFSRAGGFLINQKNIGGATALHIAARSGNAEIASILLENGANVNIVDNEGWTPLMRASIAGNSKIVEILLDKGANAALLSSDRETALVYATVSDCHDCLNAIFTKSDLLKIMDSRLLKEQLIDAFIIARNRENKITQNLLEGYLDRVTKMAPLVVSSNSGSATNSTIINSDAVNQASSSDQYLSPTTLTSPQEFLAQNGKVKYILLDDGKPAPYTAIPSPQNTPIIPSQAVTQGSAIEKSQTENQAIVNDAAIYTPLAAQVTPMPSMSEMSESQSSMPSSKEPEISNLVQSALQPNASANSITNAQNRVTTKFKFVSGAPGVSSIPAAPIKEQKSNGVSYKFHTGSKKLDRVVPVAAKKSSQLQ